VKKKRESEGPYLNNLGGGKKSGGVRKEGVMGGGTRKVTA